MENIKLFFKSLFIQVLINKEEMQKWGYSFLTNGRINTFINSNPYFAVLIGTLSEKEPKNTGIYSSMIAMYGDNFIWNYLKPVILLTALIFIIMKIYIAIIPLFMLYFVIVTLIRLFGHNYGNKIIKGKKMLFDESIWKISLNVMKYLKILLIGFVFAYILVYFVIYLKINPLYAILSIFIIIALIIKNVNILTLMVLWLLILNLKV